MAGNSNIVDVNVIFCHRTERAIGFWRDETEMELDKKVTWIPLAQCEVSGRLQRGSIIELSMEERTAIEKGLI